MSCASGSSGGGDADTDTSPDGWDVRPETDAADAEEGDCPAGLSSCGGTCVDLMTDRGNCGGCGRSCAAVEICADGECVIECPSGQTQCGGSCVDTQSDHDHCGGCGRSCAADEVCNEGDCLGECGSGYTDCFGSCVDLQTSPFHCGFCGNACNMGEDCIDGSCAGGCGNGLCAGVDGENQCSCPADCGACAGCCLYGSCFAGGTTDACGSGGGSCDVCSAGEICSGGACACRATPCGSECCVEGQRCVSGRCCGETWTASVPNVYLTGVAIDTDGTIYVSGQTHDKTGVFVAALDACGALLSSTSYVPPGSVEAHGNRVALGTQVMTAGHIYTGSDVYTAGYCGFTKHPVSIVRCDAIDLSAGNEAYWGIAASPGGFFWLSGFFEAPSATRPTMMKSTGLGSACGWDPLANTGGGEGRDLQVSGSSVYATGIHQGQGYVAGYSYDDCMTGGPCPHCDPDTLVHFMEPGSSVSMGYDVAVSGGMAYVGGYKVISDSGAYAPMLAKVNLSTGTVVASTNEPDVTPDLDVYSGVATDGTAVFGVGAHGYTGIGTLGTAQGFLARVRTSDMVREVVVAPPAIDAIYDVAIDGAGGVVCAGSSAASGYVMRCLSDGTCAP
jgi:hypothetical protein